MCIQTWGRSDPDFWPLECISSPLSPNGYLMQTLLLISSLLTTQKRKASGHGYHWRGVMINRWFDTMRLYLQPTTSFSLIAFLEAGGKCFLNVSLWSCQECKTSRGIRNKSMECVLEEGWESLLGTSIIFANVQAGWQIGDENVADRRHKSMQSCDWCCYLNGACS